MLTLALESSAKAASVALMRDGALIAQYFQNSGLTHSRTLMSMAEDILKNTDNTLSDIGLIAVARGPGSFTGIRIGVAAAKGLAWAGEIPVAGVSTLDAMAWHGISAGESVTICAVMDARRNEVYNSLYNIRSGAPAKIAGDRAISAQELAAECAELGNDVFLVGDGAELMRDYLESAGVRYKLAPAPMLMQSAWGVAMEGARVIPYGPERLIPEYLRLSQAERERRERMEKGGK